MKVAIVNKQTLEVVGSYEAAEIDSSSLNRSALLSEPVCMHLEVPENLDLDCIQYKKGKIVADKEKAAAKLQAKREAVLEQIRVLREPKLARVDQLVNIAILDVWTSAEKKELKAYRQALLDITKPYKKNPESLDNLQIEAIEWPKEPSEK